MHEATVTYLYVGKSSFPASVWWYGADQGETEGFMFCSLLVVRPEESSEVGVLVDGWNA